MKVWQPWCWANCNDWHKLSALRAENSGSSLLLAPANTSPVAASLSCSSHHRLSELSQPATTAFPAPGAPGVDGTGRGGHVAVLPREPRAHTVRATRGRHRGSSATRTPHPHGQESQGGLLLPPLRPKAPRGRIRLTACPCRRGHGDRSRSHSPFLAEDKLLQVKEGVSPKSLAGWPELPARLSNCRTERTAS